MTYIHFYRGRLARSFLKVPGTFCNRFCNLFCNSICNSFCNSFCNCTLEGSGAFLQVDVCHMRRRIHVQVDVCHMRRRIHVQVDVCHMRRRIHVSFLQVCLYRVLAATCS